jgi:hypothetical protein
MSGFDSTAMDSAAAAAIRPLAACGDKGCGRRLDLDLGNRNITIEHFAHVSDVFWSGATAGANEPTPGLAQTIGLGSHDLRRAGVVKFGSTPFGNSGIALGNDGKTWKRVVH